MALRNVVIICFSMLYLLWFKVFPLRRTSWGPSLPSVFLQMNPNDINGGTTTTTTSLSSQQIVNAYSSLFVDTENTYSDIRDILATYCICINCLILLDCLSNKYSLYTLLYAYRPMRIWIQLHYVGVPSSILYLTPSQRLAGCDFSLQRAWSL